MGAIAKTVERKTENAIPSKNFSTQNRKRNEMAKNNAINAKRKTENAISKKKFLN